MSTAAWFVIIAATAALFVFSLFKQRGSDRFDALAARLRERSRIVSRGTLVDGTRRKSVLLALTDSSFIYESSDGQSSFDRQWIREVGYESAHNVLRLRCFSRTFEFVLAPQVFHEWEAVLPAFCDTAGRL